MKLDRNQNKDGRGKYALINLRTNQVQWGGDDQFFVIKYKDRFAEPALRAYAKAVRMEAEAIKNTVPPGAAEDAFWVEQVRVADGLLEYAAEIEREADLAGAAPWKKLPD